MDFTERWLVMITIAIILFAIALLILRINIRSLLIFFVIGISAVTLWMIVDATLPPRARGVAIQRAGPASVPYVIMTTKKCVSKTDVHAV